MNAEIILVGTELLLGDIIDTNGKYLARALASMGINLFYQTVVGDNRERLLDVIRRALTRSDILIFSGGLGPTADDLTRETVAEAMGLELKEDEETVKRLRAFFAGRNMTLNNLRQALVPEGGQVLTNDWGTAPGLYIKKDTKQVFMLPGPPRELEPMFEARVRPILEKESCRVFVSTDLNLYGIGESSAEAKLRDLMENPDPTLAPYAGSGEVRLRITSSGSSREECLEKNRLMLEKVRERVGEYIYAVDGESLEKALVERFSKKGLKVAAAESLTAGLISSRIGSIPGASEVMEEGIVTYCDRVKREALGVKKETLEKYSAVSEETAAEMAQGIRRVAGSDVGISATGYAGPTGENVGLVYVGASFKDKLIVRKLETRRTKLERNYIRALAANAALALALQITDLFGYENGEINL
ncbi:MAG: competence/damage-inducible protein A [Clostridia bacterium]|nr:competence/damage-inducible protein A [Clostridia bacterium]